MTLFPKFCLLVLMMPVFAFAQTTNFSYVDPAQAFNKLIIEKSNSTFYRISNYKVIGSPFLYGEEAGGTLFRKGQAGVPDNIRYNTFDQMITFGKENQSVEPPTKIDSFSFIRPDEVKELLFVSGSVYGAKEGYYQRVYTGPKYSLFKRYDAELRVVSTNYIQSDLREFDLVYEYYYADSSAAGLKKIKPKYAALVKEFKSAAGLKDAIPQNFGGNPEAVLLEAFIYINK